MTIVLRILFLLTAAVKVTVPEPLPDCTLGVSHLGVSDTLQAPHVEPAVIVTDALPPALGYNREMGDTVNAQAADACDTLIV
jgi:hypothetical protein